MKATTEILTGMGADAMKRVLSEVSNQGLERLLQLAFEELKGRGIHFGLDGPYPTWDYSWGMDAVGVLEVRSHDRRYTVAPTPNPRATLSTPSS